MSIADPHRVKDVSLEGAKLDRRRLSSRETPRRAASRQRYSGPLLCTMSKRIATAAATVSQRGKTRGHRRPAAPGSKSRQCITADDAIHAGWSTMIVVQSRDDENVAPACPAATAVATDG